MKTEWQFSLPSIEGTSHFREWLLFPGSFMKRLQEHGTHDACVNVIFQGWAKSLDEESAFLNLKENAAVWIREVLISSGIKPLMFARSVFPASVLEGKYKAFQQLENRSLGSLLFDDPNVTRGNFQFAKIDEATFWWEKSLVYLSTCEKLWARRCLFQIQNRALLLTEVFFPTLEEIYPFDLLKLK